MQCDCGSVNIEDINELSNGVLYIKRCRSCGIRFTQLGVDMKMLSEPIDCVRVESATIVPLGKPTREEVITKTRFKKKKSKKKQKAADQSQQLTLE